MGGVLENIPENEKNDFLAFGNEGDLKSVYLANDIMPKCKYFVLQPFHASFSREVAEDIRNSLVESAPKWLLTGRDLSLIGDIVVADYELVNETDDCLLYRITK